MPDNSLDPLFYTAGQGTGIDPLLLRALSHVESGVNPNVRDSYQGAQGLMQMLPATAASMGAANPRDPSQAIPAAAKYLAEGFDKTGSVEGALRYYHGGPDQRQWGPKTQAYVGKVAAAYAALKGKDVAAKKQQDDPYADLIKEYGGAPAAAPVAGPSASAPAAAPADPYGDLVREFSTQPIQVAQPAPAPAKGASQAYRGSVLPFSIDEQGNTHFDSDAGILGAFKNALTLPGDVYSGKVNPLSEEGLSRARDMAASFTPLNAGAIAKVARPMPAPTSDALRAASAAGYDAMRNSGATYSAEAVAALAQGMRQQAENYGILGELAPKSFSVVNRLTDPPAGSVAPITGLEAARRGFINAGKDFSNETEQLAARRFKQGLDEFVQSPPTGAVVSGDAGLASSALPEARGNWAAAKRSEALTTAQDNAERAAAAANSGLNEGNAIRGRVKSLLQSPKAIAGFSDAEKAALEEVARGTATRNTLRYVAGILGGGGGLGALQAGAAGGAAAAGFTATGSPWGMIGAAVPPLVGFMARKAENALTARSLARADETVRMNSPLYNALTGYGPSTQNLLLGPQSLFRGTALWLNER